MSFKFPNMPSLKTLLGSIGAGGLLSQMPLMKPDAVDSVPDTGFIPLGNAPSCPINSPLSCHSSAKPSCCFINPGGQLLQTQFWDTHPVTGPKDSWTIHGLWPDLCDGTYDKFCNSAPQYTNITQILTAAGQDELLDYMHTYWVPDRGSVETFWEHEWNKHGTCINTLAPKCYGNSYSTGEEVVDFFSRTVELFKTLDTYSALRAAGIVPSKNHKYTAKQIQDALMPMAGGKVVLGCSKGSLNQVYYAFNVKGSLQTGTFVPTTPEGKGSKGTCPKNGIKYLPK